MLRVTFLFRDSSLLDGWSETYYLNAFSTPQQFLGGARTPIANGPADQMIETRRKMFSYAPNSTVIQLYKMRMSVPGPGRNFFVYNLPASSQSGTFATNVASVEAWTRLLVTLNMPGGASGRLFLGALPESTVYPPNGFAPFGTGWTARFDRFYKLLTDPLFGWQLRRRSQQSNANLPIVPIAGLQPANDGRTAVLTAGPIGVGGANPPVQGKLIIRGRHPSEWNGIHRYTWAALSGAYSVGPSRLPLGDWATLGTIQLYQDDFEGPTGYQLEHFVKRDTGNPSGRPRGRRRRAV